MLTPNNWKMTNGYDSCYSPFFFLKIPSNHLQNFFVLQVLNLEWSTSIDTVRCSSDAELNLNGSFADMILLPDAGLTNHNSTAALFVLTNPGQITVYDAAALSMLKSADGDVRARAEKFPVVVPTIDPHITVAKFCLLPMGHNPSKVLLKVLFQIMEMPVLILLE